MVNSLFNNKVAIPNILASCVPNGINDSIVGREEIIKLPLHIKLGLLKQFMKADDRNSY